MPPPIEPLLLRRKRRRRRLRGPFLQDPVHLLVLRVILRAARTAVVDLDPLPHPGETQCGPSSWTHTAKGRTIVRSDRSGFTVTAEQTLHHRSNSRFAGAHVPHGQNISARQIAHRQRVHPPAISRIKRSLEVDRPHVVRCICRRTFQSRDPRTWPGPPRLPLSQPRLPQPPPNRRDRRTGLLRSLPPQRPLHFRRA